jgi:hypothetical protein
MNSRPSGNVLLGEADEGTLKQKGAAPACQITVSPYLSCL